MVVADRGADIYEHLQQCHRQGLGFVVRAAQNRALVVEAGKTAASRLFDWTRAQPSTGTFPLALVDLREKSRLKLDLPAEVVGLTANELRVLRHQSRRPLDTVRAVYLALVALGGHLGRKGDGPLGLARPPEPAPARGGREHGGATA